MKQEQTELIKTEPRYKLYTAFAKWQHIYSSNEHKTDLTGHDSASYQWRR